MCDNNRTNIGNKYDDDSSYSSQTVGYSGQPQQRDHQHTPLSNQDLQQASNDYDASHSSEAAGDRNDGPPSQTTQGQQYSSSSVTPADDRTNGSGPGSMDMPGGNKRLHVSNIPFRFRENDLHGVFAVS